MLRVEALSFTHSAKDASHNESWHFSFTVPTGSIAGILGESGAGKSTLLNLLAGFYSPSSGDIYFDGERLNDLPPAQRPISILFQDNNLFEHLTVEQNIGLGLHPGLQLSVSQLEAIDDIIRKIGIAGKNKALPSELSGGQRQRVALARCLLRNKPILLLDEPFTGLDVKTRLDLIELVKQFQREQGTTVLLVTHHKEESLALADMFVEVEKK